MKLTERQKKMLELFETRERLKVKELTKLFYVSDMTVRRDLDELEGMGYITRFRGGAVYNGVSENMPIRQRFFVDEEEKKALARKAAQYLQNDSSVFIDSSATCAYLMGHIKKHQNIKVFTNSVNTLQIASRLKISCVLIGGEYDAADMCLVGPLAEQFAEQINVDVAFFSSQGYDSDGTVSDTDLLQTTVRKRIMKNSGQNVFLFEKNRMNKKYLYTLCTVENDIVIILND
ncbi:MAG: DeoR/GlpR transcriptional regulator [Oscillospiraceae bacterium]|jgi:DeoR/GlpR family transcriptional regulator of sugar metabolism|nr:DeoR/GlpR transcriptional regulator [Oscillospiraceae bacterium]MBQ8918020.1 DeoR/GlpR transcriptional regulator [Oscillospiraceae bacterium]MBQ9108998.1 DeoR/GlpR transcriptional regulator [Oscillospiraceae bacterium]